MSNLSLKLEQKAKILQVQRLTIQMLALHAQNLADFLQEQVTDNPCWISAITMSGRPAIRR